MWNKKREERIRKVIKNAIAYITRKKNRTFIIFVILTIVLSCLYSCLTIMKSSNEIEKTLYESSNSSISITFYIAFMKRL